MTFAAPIEHKIPTDQERELQIAELESRITFLGKKVSEAEDILAEHNLTQEDILKAKSILDQVNTEIEAQVKKLNDLKSEVKDHEDAVQKLRDQEEIDLNKLADLGNDIDAAMSDLEIAGAEKLKVEADKNELDKIIADLHQRMMDISGESVAAQKELDTLSQELANTRQYLADTKDEITVGQQKVTALCEQVQAKQKEIADLDDQIQILNTHKVTLSQQVQEVSGQIEANKQAAQVELNKQKEELIKREGDVSEREAWLQEKQNNLKTAKMELEKFYGRKISTVIIE